MSIAIDHSKSDGRVGYWTRADLRRMNNRALARLAFAHPEGAPADMVSSVTKALRPPAPAPLPKAPVSDTPEIGPLLVASNQYSASAELGRWSRQIVLFLLAEKYGNERAAKALHTIPEAAAFARTVFCKIVAANALSTDPTPENFTALFTAQCGEPEQYRFTRRDIVKMTAEAFKLSVADLRSARRTRDLVRPRHIAMFLCKQFTPGSYPEIGRAMGNRDHTTALFACRKIQAIVDAKGIDFGPDIRAWIKGFADMAGRGELTA